MRAALLSLCLVVIAGCKVKNPNYCEETDNHLCTDGGVDAPETCSTSDPCDTGVCKEPPGVCVECLTQAQCTDAAEPVCNTMTNTCEKCTAHSQCDSGVCALDTGRCELETAVAYVDGTTGNDAGDCAKGAACRTLDYALGRGRDIIKIAGATTTAGGVTLNNRNVSIFGDTGSSITRNTGTIFDIRGTSNVKIFGLEITGGGTVTTGVAISESATVRLDRVRLSNNGTVGLNMANGSLQLLRSNIIDNRNGGIVITNGQFAIVGNMFTNNGDDTTSVGALSVGGPQNASNRLEFNSFTRNETNGGQGSVIHCVVTGFTIRNNIIFGNMGAPTSGNCTHTYSLIDPMPTAGTGIISGNPLFEDATTGKLHLKAGSPALGKADPATTFSDLTTDLDGHVRMTPADLGADEVP